MDYPLTLSQMKDKSAIVQLLWRFGPLGFLADLVLLNASFMAVHFYRLSDILLSSAYMELLAALNGTWLLTSLLLGKFRKEKYASYRSGIFTIVTSAFYLTYGLAFVVIILEYFNFSRGQVFGTCLLYAVAQVGWFTTYYLLRGKALDLPVRQKIASRLELWERFSPRRFTASLLLVTGAFYVLNYWKRGSFTLSLEYEQALWMVYGIWFIASAYTGKFARRPNTHFVQALAPYVKALFLSIAMLAVAIFLFRLFYFSRLHIFGTFVLVGFAEIFLYFLYSDLPFITRKERDIETLEEVEEVLREDEVSREEAIFSRVATPFLPVEDKLRDQYLKDHPQVFSFLKKHMNLSHVSTGEAVVLNTRTFYNVQNIADHSLTLFINLQRLNDFRRINQYFLEVHKKFYNGSCFMGCVETIETHRQKIFKKFPEPLGSMIYGMNFLIFRVLPKLPVVNKLYFLFTRGKNRVLSRAEVLGRLYFCGFKVIATRIINDQFYFIARKEKHPSADTNPSYGPLIKLRRVGYQGKIIYVNKLRTMHPYSEYLQDYIYEQNQLQSNGKFQNDFRVTRWGKLFRKLWIDELPQLANFFRGDLALVGVRALSEHYFSLYPEDVQELRIQFKPGLVPPFYADMPNSFEEIIASERRYLLSKQLNPLTTDVKYFFKVMYNIFFKHARSR